MDLRLSEEQVLFRNATRDFIANRGGSAQARRRMEDDEAASPEDLREASALGWFATFVPEDHGGGSVSGHAVMDCAIVAEERGAVVQPGPFLAPNVVAAVLADHGSPPQRNDVLPDIAERGSTATFALAGDALWSASPLVRGTVSPDGFVLTGGPIIVPDLDIAEWVLVTADVPDQGPVALLVRADAVRGQARRLGSLDLTMRLWAIDFPSTAISGDALVATVETGATVVRRAREVALALSLAESVGAMDRLFSLTVDYARNRFAFGRPIGSFQALKHLLADLSLSVESCKAVAAAAARAVDSGQSYASEVCSIAKTHVGERGIDVSQGCLQVHGGIGFAWEHDLHLYMRRLATNNALLGTPAFHRRQIAAAHGLKQG